MSDSNDVLNNFMTNKNREALGEKADTVEEKDDNFLAEPEKMKQTFTGETSSNESDKAYMYARRALSLILTIPILMGGIASLFYLLLKSGPYVLNFAKTLIIKFFS